MFSFTCQDSLAPPKNDATLSEIAEVISINDRAGSIYITPEWPRTGVHEAMAAAGPQSPAIKAVMCMPTIAEIDLSRHTQGGSVHLLCYNGRTHLITSRMSYDWSWTLSPLPGEPSHLPKLI